MSNKKEQEDTAKRRNALTLLEKWKKELESNNETKNFNKNREEKNETNRS